MATTPLAVVCAWCTRVVTPAPAGSPITHTICPSCMETAMVQATSTLTPGKFDLDRPSLPDGYFGNAFK